MRRLLGAATQAALLLVAAGFGGCDEDSSQSPARGPLIDEQRGVIRGVGLGDSLDQIEQTLGRGQRVAGDATFRVPAEPLKGGEIEDLGMPWIVEPPHGSKDEGFEMLRLDNMVFLATEGHGV